MFFKKNKYFIITYILVILIILFSFYQYYDEYFSYSKTYYEIKENCYEKHDLTAEKCQLFKDEEQLESYIEINDPQKAYKELDTIKLTSSIVRHTSFSVLQFLSPLLIIFVVIGSIHNEFSTGFYKNVLQRTKYKDYIKEKYKVVIKAALIFPIALLIVFLLSCFITKFNFNVAEETKNIAIYNEWKYNNFLVYGFSIIIIQFFISLLYGNIALFGIKRNKNMIVSIILSYVMFFVVHMFIYLVIYAIIINSILGFKNLTDYFNITGYWHFDNGPHFLYVIPLSIIFFIISKIILFLNYRKKEEVIIQNEFKDA